jgi:hypothetical protein
MMTAENSCGDPQWLYDRLNQMPDSPYEKTQADLKKSEIARLNHELMKIKVYVQSELLKDLDEQHFRDTNPTVKDAWDQYQTILRLAKGE